MRVKIESDGDQGGRVFNADTGELLHVVSATVFLAVGKLPRAVVEIAAPALSAVAEAKFAIVDPHSGLRKTVKRIEFEDGSSFGG